MDYSAFSDENFDAKDWVNRALESGSNESNRQLVVKLQAFISKVNEEVEKICQQLVTDLPGVVRNIDIVAQEVDSLKQNMNVVGRDIEAVEHSTAETMSVLVELDDVRHKMETTFTAVQEAQNWEKLAADVDAALESDDPNRIASALLALQRSMLVLDSPDADVDEKLDRLKARLKRLLRPQLVAAFKQLDQEQSRQCVDIYRDMMLLPEALTILQEEFCSQLQALWEQQQQAAPSQDAQLLLNFLAKMSENSLVEAQYLQHVFGAEAAVHHAHLFQFALPNLSPSPMRYFEQVYKTSDAEWHLSAVSELQRVVLEFDKQHTLPREAFDVYFDAAAHFQTSFERYVLDDLRAQWEKSAAEGKDDLEEGDSSTTVIGEQAAQVATRFDKILQSMLRVMIELTAGGAADGLIQAVEAHVKFAAEHVEIAVKQLQERQSSLDGAGDTQVWAEALEASMVIVRSCGEVLLNLTRFGEQLRAAVLEHRRHQLGNEREHDSRDYLSLTQHANDLAVFLPLLHKCAQGEVLFNFDSHMSNVAKQAHLAALSICMLPIRESLVRLPTAEEWQSYTVSDPYDLPPSPCVTQIGEELLKLPQSLSNYLEQAEEAAFAALSCCTPEEFEQPNETDIELLWMGAIARQTSAACIDAYSSIAKVSSGAVKQIVVDLGLSLQDCKRSLLTASADYLFNVLTALQSLPSEELLLFRELLVAESEDEFAARIADASNASSSRATAIATAKRMRNIKL